MYIPQLPLQDYLYEDDINSRDIIDATEITIHPPTVSSYLHIHNLAS
jgi:hypothetical protein